MGGQKSKWACFLDTTTIRLYIIELQHNQAASGADILLILDVLRRNPENNNSMKPYQRQAFHSSLNNTWSYIALRELSRLPTNHECSACINHISWVLISWNMHFTSPVKVFKTEEIYFDIHELTSIRIDSSRRSSFNTANKKCHHSSWRGKGLVNPSDLCSDLFQSMRSNFSFKWEKYERSIKGSQVGKLIL